MEVTSKPIIYDADTGESIELLGNTKGTSSNKLNENLLSLGIDLNVGSQYDTYIYTQINTSKNGSVSVIRDSTKYKFIINADGNSPEIVQELDKNVGTASIDIEQLLEDKTGNLFYILTSNSDVDVDGVTHYKDDYSVVKISSDKTIEMCREKVNDFIVYNKEKDTVLYAKSFNASPTELVNYLNNEKSSFKSVSLNAVSYTHLTLPTNREV